MHLTCALRTFVLKWKREEEIEKKEKVSFVEKFLHFLKENLTVKSVEDSISSSSILHMIPEEDSVSSSSIYKGELRPVRRFVCLFFCP